MTNRAIQFVLAGIILFAAANLNAQGPQKRGDRPAPGAAASPVPASAAPNASSSTAIFNAPQHSPDQLDFGLVSVGASSLKTFTLTTNAAGNVSVTIPPGPFRIAEFRELGALQGGSKNSTNPLNAGGFSPQVKSRITYRVGQSGPFQWSMAPNEQIQLDIVFAPKSQTITGVSSEVMNVNGPGPHGNWVLTIPLRGTSNAMKAASPDNSQQASVTHTGNVLPLSGKGGGSSPGVAPPSTTRRLTPTEALSRMHSAGKPVLVATARNSKLAKNGIETNIFTQLKQQKQTADLERSRIMAANPRGGVQTTKSMGSSGAGNVATASPAVAGVGGGNNLSQAQAPVGNALACAKSAPDALIFSINGQKNNAAVLTTDPDSNLFTFNGCNFGDTQGSIHLYGGFAHGNIPFEVSFWNDHGIVARVQPDLTGELDRDSVNLVLVSGNGHQTQFQGFKFYAARQTYVLSSIPNLESKIIYGPPDPAHCEHAENYTFMSCGAFTDPNDGLPVYVSRWGVKGDKGTDQFTISGLKPGFEISDISVWISPEISSKQGWSIYSFAENISVNYVFDWKKPIADYGLRISVSGPRGIDSPWK